MAASNSSRSATERGSSSGAIPSASRKRPSSPGGMRAVTPSERVKRRAFRARTGSSIGRYQQLGVPALVRPAPRPVGHRLDGQPRHSLPRRLLHDLRPEVAARVADVVDRKEDGVEGVAVQQGEGRLYRVRGKTDVADHPPALRLGKRLHGPARGEDLLDLLHPGDGVKLVKVEVIRLEAAEGPRQLLPRPGGRALQCLTGKEHPLPAPQEGPAQLALRLALPVEGGDVEVVHPAGGRLFHQGVHPLLRHAEKRHPPQPEDGQLHAVAERSSGNPGTIHGAPERWTARAIRPRVSRLAVPGLPWAPGSR